MQLTTRQSPAATLVLCLAGLGCSNISNRGSRELQIHDLSQYTLAAAPELGEVPLYMSDVAGTRPAPVGNWIFATNNGLWGARGGGWTPSSGKAAPLHLTRIADSGEVAETKTYDMSDYGYDGYGFVSGVTGDDQGRLWVAFNADTDTDLVAISLASDAIVHTFAAPHMPLQSNIRLSYAGGLLYVGVPSRGSDPDALVAIDAETGATVRDYRDTVLAKLAELGSDLSDKWSRNESAVAVAGDTLLVRGANMETSIFDAETGEHLGILGDAPHGAICGNDAVFLAADGSGHAKEFVPSADRVSGLVVEQVKALDRTGARTITASRGMLWVFYSDGHADGDLIAYDPGTFEPVEGFALHSETLTAIYDYDPEIQGSAAELFGLTATDQAFYFQSAHRHVNSGGPKSTFHRVDYRTGKVDAVLSVPEMVFTSVCHDGTNLWVIDVPDASDRDPRGQPTLHALDAESGLEQSAFTGPALTAGYGSIACTADGMMYSGDRSRLWVETSPDGGSPSFNAMSLPSAGASVVAIADKLWMLDRQRNLLIVASRP